MSKVNTNAPAFPVSPELCQDLTVEEQRGMTLRDYFAAQVLVGICANQDNRAFRGAEQFANVAYQLADAMLKARKV